ncbi:hypothetical protein EDD18DRAFT_1394496 [Armillaria luteobubalina]|uniref:Translocon-associated protein subunit alpha n=1 Tax=Armillaria luteobubalina TaxID=153913 RepID=A0AA39Q4W5_9AGAR|nr:hypothetical protein EDD18DRAFT_1394496 [Armillaria luteobubalina]
MRLSAFFGTFASVAALAQVALSQSTSSEEPIEPEIAVVASWPDDNPFAHVVNGEKNLILLSIENKSDRNVTLLSMSGSVHHPDTNALVKNLTAVPYGIVLVEAIKLQLPFTFYSEFKPGDLRLNIWLEHSFADEKYLVSAYDSIVTVVEPEISIFDFKLLSTYLVVSLIFGGIAYIAYLSFVPQSKKPRRTAASVSAPVGSVTATGAGGYQEEWIPEHHLRKSKGKKGGPASGDELSGGETSGTEGKKRKGRK